MAPITPILPSSFIVASGNCEASSHSITCGAISRSENSRMDFRSCNCSSLSWKSKRRLLRVRDRPCCLCDQGKTDDYFTGTPKSTTETQRHGEKPAANQRELIGEKINVEEVPEK